MKNHLLPVIGSVALVCCVICLAISRGFYISSVDSQFFCVSLLSVVLVHLSVRPWRDAVWILLGAGALAALDFGVMRYHAGLVPVASLAGLSSVAVFGVSAMWAPKEQRRILLYGFLPAVMFVGSEWVASILLNITELLHPKTYDLYLFSFDASLGRELSFVVGRWFAHFSWLRFAGFEFYVGLPLIIALVYGRQLKAQGRMAGSVALGFLITGPLGVLFYNVLPAMGPIHVFPSFPADALPTAQVSRLLLEPIKLAGPRNAIPSLHMAWVLLAWWNSKGLAAWTRVVAMAFLVFTVLATMGTGEHYFVDLVVAFPFALFVQGLSRYDIPMLSTRRAMPLFTGLAMTILWLEWLLYGVKFAWITPILPWTVIAATIACSVYLSRWVQPEAIGISSLSNAEVGSTHNDLLPEDARRSETLASE